jgi:hypothetical protein
MDGMMKEKDRMWNEFVELLERYNDGSFARMVCDYIRSTGMTRQEVERLLEEMRKAKGGVSK